MFVETSVNETEVTCEGMREVDAVRDKGGDLGVSRMGSGWIGVDSKDEGGLSVVIPWEWTCRTRDDSGSVTMIVGRAVGIDQGMGLSVDGISWVSSDVHGAVESCCSLLSGG